MTVVIIQEYHCYQLKTIFIEHSLQLTPKVGEIIAKYHGEFRYNRWVVIRYSAFFRCWKKWKQNGTVYQVFIGVNKANVSDGKEVHSVLQSPRNILSKPLQ